MDTSGSIDLIHFVFFGTGAEVFRTCIHYKCYDGVSDYITLLNPQVDIKTYLLAKKSSGNGRALSLLLQLAIAKWSLKIRFVHRIFMVGFQLVGQELAVELTFDTVGEDISLGVINMFGFFLGILVTITVKNLQETFSILYGNLCFSLLIMIGTMFIALINSYELKRQEVVNFIDSAVEEDFGRLRNTRKISDVDEK